MLYKEDFEFSQLEIYPTQRIKRMILRHIRAVDTSYIFLIVFLTQFGA